MRLPQFRRPLAGFALLLALGGLKIIFDYDARIWDKLLRPRSFAYDGHSLSICRVCKRCCLQLQLSPSSLLPSSLPPSLLPHNGSSDATMVIEQHGEASTVSERPGGLYPDCPCVSEVTSGGEARTAGGCRLDDVHQFLFGHDTKDRTSAVQLRACAAVSPNLVGTIQVFHCQACICDLDRLNFYVTPGGSYEPRHCIARGRAAVIIPFRNRWQHLSEFLLNVHPLLQKQELAYTIFVVNQQEGSKFNRGMLMNIGAVESTKIDNFTCFIFHDVDLLPENDKNLYRCPNGFHHYSVAVDKFNYKLPYDSIVGGVLAANRRDFEKVNGYSNLYFGWGGEDDDMSGRITTNGYTIQRFSADISRYQMAKHVLDKENEVNPQRFKLLQSTDSRSKADGLNSLVYKVDAVTKHKLFTLVDVTINQQEVMNNFSGIAAKATRRR